MIKKLNRDYKIVFCDSEQALQRAYDDNLSKKITVRTSSPALCMANSPNIQHLERGLAKSKINNYRNAALPLAKEVYQYLQNDIVLKEYALTVARVVTRWHSMLYKALALTENDLELPCLVLGISCGDQGLDNILTVPWNYFLKNNQQCEFIEYPVSVPDTQFTKAPALMKRLRMLNHSRIGYQFYLGINKLLRSKNHRRAFIISTNEFLEEIAYLFASNGVAIKKIDNIKIPENKHENTNSLHELIYSKLSSVMHKFIENWLICGVKSGAIDLFSDYLYEALNKQLHGKHLWKKVLDNNQNRPGDMVLSNYPGAPEYIALADCCREKNIKFITFQHGVTREICATLDIGSVGYENGVADYFFTYSKIASDISNESSFARGKCIVAGLPESYVQKPNNKIFTKNEILYVSTNCYAGNVNLRGGGENDMERAQNELLIVEEVLSKLPYKILYKTYPHIPRYSEEDPVLVSARKKKNITTFESSTDLRYIIRKYRLIVTARATSTIGWCIMSGRPIVMIDYPDHMPLKEKARHLFNDGIFLFDAGSPDFLDNLRCFLEQSFDVIEKLWLDKQIAREKLINQYFPCVESNTVLNISHFLSELDAEIKAA